MNGYLEGGGSVNDQEIRAPNWYENVSKVLVPELVRLRKSVGLTRRKVAASPTLLALPAIDRALEREGLSGVGSEQRVVVATRLLHALLAQGSDIRSEATRHAFAIAKGTEGTTLTERRNRFASDHHLSVDSVRSYERQRLEELAHELVELGELAPGDRHRRSAATELVRLDTEPVPSRLLFRSVDQTYRFATGRIPASL